MESQKIKKISGLYKVAAIFAVIFVPLLILVIFFSLFVQRKHTKNYARLYALNERFTREDVIEAVRVMRSDPEFYYYFLVLTNQNLAHDIDRVYRMADTRREKGKLLALIQERKEDIENASTLLLSLDFSDHFIDDPVDYPQLGRTLWSFINDDFQLALLGLIYKRVYDKNFHFSWSEDTRQAGQRVQKILSRMQRTQWENFRLTFDQYK